MARGSDPDYRGVPVPRSAPVLLERDPPQADESDQEERGTEEGGPGTEEVGEAEEVGAVEVSETDEDANDHGRCGGPRKGSGTLPRRSQGISYPARRNHCDIRISGMPMMAVGSSLDMFSSSAMPAASERIAPAQSNGSSRST